MALSVLLMLPLCSLLAMDGWRDGETNSQRGQKTRWCVLMSVVGTRLREFVPGHSPPNRCVAGTGTI